MQQLQSSSMIEAGVHSAKVNLTSVLSLIYIDLHTVSTYPTLLDQ